MCTFPQESLTQRQNIIMFVAQDKEDNIMIYWAIKLIQFTKYINIAKLAFAVYKLIVALSQYNVINEIDFNDILFVKLMKLK